MTWQKISKLDAANTFHMGSILRKVNEIIDALNAEFAPKDYSATANLDPIGKQAYESYKNLNRNLQSLLDEWNVNFYDDVEPKLESPVYCRNCQYRSVSLLDRMMLNPQALCAGCAYKSANG